MTWMQRLRRRSWPGVLALALVLALTVTGCGGAAQSGGSASVEDAPAAPVEDVQREESGGASLDQEQE